MDSNSFSMMVIIFFIIFFSSSRFFINFLFRLDHFLCAFGFSAQYLITHTFLELARCLGVMLIPPDIISDNLHVWLLLSSASEPHNSASGELDVLGDIMWVVFLSFFPLMLRLGGSL